MNIDPLVVYQSPMPDVWEIEPSILAHFPPGKFLFTPRELEMRDQILRNRWFLTKNVHGWRCGLCGQKHEYLTKHCFDLPLNALNEMTMRGAAVLRDQGAMGGLRVHYQERAVAVVKAGEVVPISQEDALRLLKRIKEKEVNARILALLK